MGGVVGVVMTGNYSCEGDMAVVVVGDEREIEDWRIEGVGKKRAGELHYEMTGNSSCCGMGYL